MSVLDWENRVRSVAVVGLYLILAPALAAQDAQGLQGAPDFAEVRRIIREGLVNEKATAAAVAVVRDGAIIWEEAFGWADSANGLRATPNSAFQLASLNKTIEATLAAILQQQHRVDLDKPVNDYLRTTSVSSPAWDVRGVTLRRLLTHTAGVSTFDLGCDTGLPASACHFPTADQTIRDYGIIARPPGAEFDYSNIGYFIATVALERAAGRSARDLMRDEVFLPLSMTTSSFGLDSAESRLAVVPYTLAWGPVRDPIGAPTEYRTARGYSSAHDLALFAAFHMKAHRRDQRAALTDAAIDSMQNATVPGDRAGSRYGLGWWIEEDRFGYRSTLAQGGNDRASTWLRMIPSERVAVVLLVNRGVGFPSQAVDAALAVLLPRYADGLAAQVRAAAAAPPSPMTPPAAPRILDSTATGRWTGAVYAAGGKVPVALAIDSTGAVRATIGTRGDSGTARLGRQLSVRIPGDLEAAAPPGISRDIRLYLKPHNGGWGGVATVRPPSATGTDGRVSYWAELRRP
ncbi:MAG TPA: serine hydrolase domain-containing protein [Gemmatimonadaceae bacterium]|nr:serine hydrolase domain-containing protein [Gemmatimonadaceae bacterium]